MKKYLRSTAVKVIAGLLFVFSVLVFCLGLGATVYSYEMDFFENVPVEFQDSDMCRRITVNQMRNDLSQYVSWYIYYNSEDGDNSNSQYYIDRYREIFSERNTNLRFTLYNENHETVLTNVNGSKPDNVVMEYSQMNFGGEYYNLECYLDINGTANDDYSVSEKFYDTIYSCRYAAVIFMVLGSLAMVGLFIFLMCASGRRENSEEIQLRLIDRLPYEAIVTFDVLIGCLIVAPLEYLGYYSLFFPTVFLVTCVCIVVGTAVLLATCMTTAVRYKRREFLKRTLCYMLLHWIYKGISRIGNVIRQIVRSIPLIWRTAVGLVVIGIAAMVLFFFAISGEASMAMLFGLIIYAAVSLVVCSIALQFSHVKQGGERIAGGDFSSVIPSQGISRDISELAERLNGINQAFSEAVEDRMKSERMKAELITNVSHDIKTPLTSIINYVDLLKKEDVQNDTAREYIDVIERQASKLKKLTVDLIEASKASTGNITVEAEPMHVTELLEQSVAEYAERLGEAGLSPIISSTNSDIIFADGKLMWRVFDNLLANICKYSQSNTRVYISVAGTGDHVEITLKNISRDALSVSPEDLMQRFVRGDSARSTEGSGLGLSIAESLVQLQGGSFELHIDGDLFKVVVCFKRYEEDLRDTPDDRRTDMYVKPVSDII